MPGRARFSRDLRHPDLAVRDRLLDGVHRICASVAEHHGVEVDVVRDKDEEPPTMDGSLLDVCRDAAERCGVSWRRMPSGAGHDSQLMASRVPTAMVFVPSVEGRSHTPAEFTSLPDCAHGASVLATALHRLAY
jgi:allantoate deiminase